VQVSPGTDQGNTRATGKRSASPELDKIDSSEEGDSCNSLPSSVSSATAGSLGHIKCAVCQDDASITSACNHSYCIEDTYNGNYD
jgi:hypothetical protein